MKTFTKKKFIQAYAKNLGVTQAQAEVYYTAFCDTLRENLTENRPVIIGDLMRLTLKLTPATIRPNPQTGEKVQVPPRLRIKSTMLTGYSEALKNG